MGNSAGPCSYRRSNSSRQLIHPTSCSKDYPAMKRLVVFVCLASALIVSKQLPAQNYLYATGDPTFSTQIPIENGFINVNNGEIHIEIPLVTHSQRGSLQLNERLV